MRLGEGFYVSWDDGYALRAEMGVLLGFVWGGVGDAAWPDHQCEGCRGGGIGWVREDRVDDGEAEFAGAEDEDGFCS